MKVIIEIRKGLYVKKNTLLCDHFYDLTEDINEATQFTLPGQEEDAEKYRRVTYGKFVKYNETSELHDLEALKDEYNQLMTEQELAEHNKKMFFRLFKKWSDKNDKLLKKMDKIDKNLKALEDLYGI